MKRNEFEERFNALFKEGQTPSLEAVTSFRADALADYDAFDTASTTMDTLNQKITDLEKVNADLHQTNYKLFLMNPAVFTQSDASNTQNSSQQNPPDPDSHVETLSDIQSNLFATETPAASA